MGGRLNCNKSSTPGSQSKFCYFSFSREKYSGSFPRSLININIQHRFPLLTLQTVSVTVSVLTLTFISIDRWYAICFPLRYVSTNERAIGSIAFIWLVALLSGKYKYNHLLIWRHLLLSPPQPLRMLTRNYRQSFLCHLFGI